MNDNKICYTCKEEKPKSEFYNQKDAKDGKYPNCKGCAKTANKEYWRNNSNRVRGYYLKYQYNITSEEYNDMFIEQKGRCATCGTHQNSLTRKLCVDHNHDTEEIRSLLCGKCNTAIGLLNDDPALAETISKYLLKFS